MIAERAGSPRRSTNTLICYSGEFRYDATKPSSMLRKLLDVSRLRELGWAATTALHEGLAKTYDWYVSQDLEAEHERA